MLVEDELSRHGLPQHPPSQGSRAYSRVRDHFGKPACLLSHALAPSFLRELADETVVLGQSVTLACQVSAQPAVQATWTKDGATLESTSRILISSTLKNFQLLTILVVKAEDLGVYTCSVSNTLGTVATTAVLRKAGEWTAPDPSVGMGQGLTPMGASGEPGDHLSLGELVPAGPLH